MRGAVGRGAWRRAERCRRAKPKSRRSRAWPAAAEPGAQGRVGDQPADRRGEGGGVAGRNQEAGLAVDRAAPRWRRPGWRRTASPWLAASISTLGRPSRSPSRAIRLASTKRSAARKAARTSAWRCAPRQAMRSARPRLSAWALRSGSSGPPPIWTKRQARSARQQGKGGQKVVVALLLHRPPDGEDDDGIGRIAARRGGGRGAVGAGKRARSRP